MIQLKVDQQQVRPPGGETSWTNATTGVLPPKRSLKSWLALSQGDTTNLSKEYPFIQGDNNQMDNRINDAFEGSSQQLSSPFHQEWPRQCVAHDN